MTGRMRKEARIERAKQRHAAIIEHGCTVDDLVALAASGKRFGVVYADPAWPWKTWSPSGKLHSCASHYSTSAVDDIMRLPVAALAAEDCALALWCTGPHIAIGSHHKVIEAWGFRPSTKLFTWIKQNPCGDGLYSGQGYYSHANSEDVFLGIKGSPLRLTADVDQVVMAPVRAQHQARASAAPDRAAVPRPVS